MGSRTKEQIRKTWEYFGHDVRGAYKKVCAICKETFFATVPGARYCGKRCAIDAQTIKDRNRRVNERKKMHSPQVQGRRRSEADGPDSAGCTAAISQPQYPLIGKESRLILRVIHDQIRRDAIAESHKEAGLRNVKAGGIKDDESAACDEKGRKKEG
jgi:hypothetical protein